MGGGAVPTDFFFFHQSQIRPSALRETVNAPPDSTVPAMRNCREHKSTRGGEMMVADKGSNEATSCSARGVYQFAIPRYTYLL